MKIISKSNLLLILLILPVFAQAATEGHDGIPWKTITVQIINVILVVGLLTYLLRKPAAQHFKGREEAYNALLTKAEQARKEAEQNRKEVTEKLSKLEQTAQSSLVQAKNDADELKIKILEEAKNLSQKLEEEAQRTVNFEIQRAKETIRKDLLSSAVEDAERSMENGVKDPDLKRLQTEFVQRVQVVRS